MFYTNSFDNYVSSALPAKGRGVSIMTAKSPFIREDGDGSVIQGLVTTYILVTIMKYIFKYWSVLIIVIITTIISIMVYDGNTMCNMCLQLTVDIAPQPAVYLYWPRNLLIA